MKTPPLIINQTPRHQANSKKAMAKRAKAIRESKESGTDPRQGWGWTHNYDSVANDVRNRSRKSNKCETCGKRKRLERRNVCRVCYNNQAKISGLQGYGKKQKKILDPHSGGTILLMSDNTNCPFPGCQWVDERRKLRLHLKNDHPQL